MEAMTQYEIYALAIGLRSEAQTTSALFLTVVSGYLVIAYVVGSSLTRAQAAIITGIFLVFTCAQVGGHYSTMIEMASLSRDVIRLNQNAVRGDSWALIFAIVNTSIIIASLKFMWDIRCR